MSSKFTRRGRIALIAGCLLALFSLAPVLSTSNNSWKEQKALEALEKGDYAAALKEFLPLARKGSSVAQFNLGFIYHEGKGVPQNFTEALKWYRLASDQGDPAAQFNLGAMYDKGDGVPQDYKEAVKWYRLAAGQGIPNAQLKMGFMYDNGTGVPQNYVQAYMWYSLAEASGSANGPEDRDFIASKMTPVQIAKAQRLAGEWKRHAKASLVNEILSRWYGALRPGP